MRRILATLILITGLSLVSCTGLRVDVSNTVPPDFTFHVGSFAECCTNFAAFAVFENDSKTLIWKIVANPIVERVEANSMVIHYGKVSDRFRQEVPTAGEPPPLVEGKRYEAVAGWTSYVPGARVRFTVKNNEIVKLPEQVGDNP